jgi:NADH:ubiquinone oxidoreductase subunit C
LNSFYKLSFFDTFNWISCFHLIEEVFHLVLGKYLNLNLKKKNLRSFFIDSFWIYFLSFFFNNNYFLKSSELSDICLVDYPQNSFKRYFIIYNFWNINLLYKYQLCFFFKKYDIIPSISSCYLSAIWLEREIYDLFGIFFFNHKDLRRILTDYGYNYHPFDKTFAVTGYSEVRYNIEQLGVFYNNLEITQEYRFFNFLSPWENNRKLGKIL